MTKINLILKINDKIVASSEWESDLTHGEEIEAGWFHTAVGDIMHFKNYSKYRDFITNNTLKTKLNDARKMIKQLLEEKE